MSKKDGINERKANKREKEDPKPGTRCCQTLIGFVWGRNIGRMFPVAIL